MRAGYRFLEKGLPQEALEHFRDVTYELDPDNKTKLHVKATTQRLGDEKFG